MTIYNIVAQRDVLRALRFGPQLTKNALEQGLAEATVEALSGDQFNQIAFRVRLKRSTHEQALSEIDWLVKEYAFNVADAAVSELAGDAVEAAIIEAFGGAGGDLTIGFAAFAGKLTEALVGAEANKIRRDYQVQRDRQGRWIVTKLSKQESASVGRQARLLPGS